MEMILEIIIEVFGEAILTIIAEAIGTFVNVIDQDKRKKKIIKYIITYLILGLTILLITLSLIFSKKVLAIIAISYMLLSLLFTLIKRINKDRFNNKVLSLIISILKRIVNYSYPIILIVFGVITLDNNKALISIIVLSIIGFIIFLSIDFYKIWKHDKKRYNWKISNFTI